MSLPNDHQELLCDSKSLGAPRLSAWGSVSGTILLVASLLGSVVLTSACERRGQPEAHSTGLTEVGPGDVQRLVRGAGAKAILVNVWSTWCEPCVEEFPALVRTGRTYAPQGLATLFISTDLAANREEALSFLEAQGAPVPRYIKVGSDQAFIPSVHPDWSGALPATVLFDSRGKARHLWEGPVDLDVLEGRIQDLLKEEPKEQ